MNTKTEEKSLVLHEGPTNAVQHPQSLTDLEQVGKLLATSGYFSDARQMAQAAVTVMAGQELGVPPIASMMGINIIKGKVTMGGNLIASRVRAHGYDFKITRHDDKGCVIQFLSKPNKGGKRAVIGESGFTEEDAKRAEVYGPMYRKYPKNMYFNRAMSNGAKWFCPEIFAGMPVYVPEELGVEIDSQGDVVHPPAPKAPYSTGETREEIVERRAREIEGKDQKAVNDTPPRREGVAKPVPEGSGGGGNGAPAANGAANGNGPVSPRLEALWKRMTEFKATVEIITELKAAIVKIQESDAIYYQILGRAGMQHANDVKGHSRREMRMVVKELLEHLEKCEAAIAEPPAEAPEASGFQASDEDVPSALGGSYRPPAGGTADATKDRRGTEATPPPAPPEFDFGDAA